MNLEKQVDLFFFHKVARIEARLLFFWPTYNASGYNTEKENQPTH